MVFLMRYSLITRFWWGQRGEERKTPWVARESLICTKEQGGMGFRDLKGFNIALLARQLWHLHQRPESLVSRIMKAKYHKNVNILEARIGYRPSYVWRSLMGVQEFLVDGLRWKIGHGSAVRIWGDRWLPSTPNNIVYSPPMGLPVDSVVRELIDEEEEKWDETILESCFPSDMVDAIKQILLRNSTEQDRLIWMDNDDGNYTAKSGYQVWLRRFQEQHDPRSVGDPALWKLLWSLNLPPKIKVFMWRFTREALASGERVNKRNPERSGACPFCDQHETQSHAFFECSWASRIWRSTGVARCFELRGDSNCMDWVRNVVKTVPVSELEEWIVLLWALWRERNAHLFNGKKMEECDIGPRAQLYLEEYRYQQEERFHSPTPQVNQTWARPPAGRVKLNTDVGLDYTGAGLGVVARDHNGAFILAAVKRIKGVRDPTLGEAMAVEFGFQLARQHQMASPIVETDCQVVVNRMAAPERVQTELGTILRNIKRLATETGGGQVQHVSRKANEAAHIMAHTKARWDIADVWFDRPPLNLLDQLASDDVTSLSS
ncbi:unnamed protein product [Linum trigynum]|uniref:Uncharacterized protein n=1 Tax=Linum trigynum TaxID=586398 RepID=A0AAV2GK67_9ROSI